MTLYEDVEDSVFSRVCEEYITDPMLTLKKFGDHWIVLDRNDRPIMEWVGHFEGTVILSSHYVGNFYKMRKEYFERMKTIRELLHE